MNKEFVKLLKDKNLTVYKLGQIANISTSTLYKIRDNETKLSSLTVETGIKLSEAFDVPLEELYELLG